MSSTRTPERSDSSLPPASRRSLLSELPVLMLIAFGLALLLKTFLIQAFFIPSRSMEPTLMVGDRVMVNKVVYDLREPRRGEVVVFKHRARFDAGEPTPSRLRRLVDSVFSGLGFPQAGKEDFIKRVIGLPGETVEVRDGVVFINGTELPESTFLEGGVLMARDGGDFGPITVEPDHYFMMGDNRPNSDDSRGSLGQIGKEEIIGRAFVIVWPLPDLGTLPRPPGFELNTAAPAATAALRGMLSAATKATA